MWGLLINPSWTPIRIQPTKINADPDPDTDLDLKNLF
jgi:hypothetical protein